VKEQPDSRKNQINRQQQHADIFGEVHYVSFSLGAMSIFHDASLLSRLIMGRARCQRAAAGKVAGSNSVGRIRL
jgi:hypothetical protein